MSAAYRPQAFVSHITLLPLRQNTDLVAPATNDSKRQLLRLLYYSCLPLAVNVEYTRRFIPLTVLVLALPWFFELLHIFIPPSKLSLAAFISPSLAEYIFASLFTLFFLLLTYIVARATTRLSIPYANCSLFHSSKAMLAACTLLLPFLAILDIVFLVSSLQAGVVETLLAFRSNEQPIGYFGYFILYYYPLILAITWAKNRPAINTVCMLFIVITNLLTGFRTLLFSSALLIFVYNVNTLARIPWRTKLTLLLCIASLFFGYGAFRSVLELRSAASSDIGGTLLDSLNRSFPIRYLVISFRSDTSATLSDLLYTFASPFLPLIQKADGVYDLETTTRIAERLVRPFLIWRGTPGYLATGFSIHIVPFSYLFYGIFGSIFFATLIGSSLGLGVKLSRFYGIMPRVAGATLITFALSVSESFVSGLSSLCYRLLLLFPLAVFSALSCRNRS